MSIPRAFVVFMLAPALGCGPPSPTPACYGVDPHSPVVWSQITDPVTFLTVDYCGRGASKREGLSRNLTAYCEPRPASGCDACAYDVDALDEKLRAEIAEVFVAVGCPADYEPEEIVPGCFAEWVETDSCCWAAEYFTDPAICDPGGSGSLP